VEQSRLVGDYGEVVGCKLITQEKHMDNGRNGDSISILCGEDGNWVKVCFTQLRLLHSIPCLSRTFFSVSLKIGHQKTWCEYKECKDFGCSQVLEAVITRGSLEVCKKRIFFWPPKWVWWWTHRDGPQYLLPEDLPFEACYKNKRQWKNQRGWEGVKGRKRKEGNKRNEVKPRGFNHHRGTLSKKLTSLHIALVWAFSKFFTSCDMM